MLEVGPSGIHGDGCFATRRIRAGAVIGRFEGEATTIDGPHVLWLGDEEALLVTNDLRFLNHAPDPNAEIDSETLALYALRPIAAGEEITIHYGDDWA